MMERHYTVCSQIPQAPKLAFLREYPAADNHRNHRPADITNIMNLFLLADAMEVITVGGQFDIGIGSIYHNGFSRNGDTVRTIGWVGIVELYHGD